MKIRTKVKAGRGCGGGVPSIQSGHATVETTQPRHAGNGAPRSLTRSRS